MLPDSVVSTLLADLLDPDGRGLDPVHLAGATADMKGRVRGMPRYLGSGMVALTLLFAGTGYAVAPRERRVRRLEAWRKGPVSFQRDFVEFWEKMGTFTYYSRLEKAGEGHGPPPGAGGSPPQRPPAQPEATANPDVTARPEAPAPADAAGPAAAGPSRTRRPARGKGADS